MIDPVAVLDASGDSVKCGACGERLATVERHGSEAWVMTLPGWTVDEDAILHPTRHSIRNQHHRNENGKGLQDRKRRQTPTAITGSFLPGHEDSIRVTWGEATNPVTQRVRAVCRRCRQFNDLNPAELLGSH